MISNIIIPKSKKRIVIRKLQSEGVLSWDFDNAYAQRIYNLIAASGTASRCVRRYASFVKGLGFSDIAVYNMIVNRQGLKMDKLLSQVSNDYAYFSGMATHIRYNGLGQVIERNYIPFMNCRLREDDKIAVYDNWDKSSLIENYNVSKIQVYNRFNPKSVIEEISECEGKTYEDKVKNYNGQIFWWSSAGHDQYPTSIADPVAEDIETDYQSKLYKNKNIRTSFTAAGAFIDIGTVESDEELEQRQEKMTDFQGAESAGNIMYINVASKEDAPIWMPFVGDPNQDKKFEYHENSVEKSIVKQFNLPLMLAGIETAGKLGGSNELKDAYHVYNSETEADRIVVAEYFSTLMGKPLNILPLTINIPSNDPIA